MRDVFVSNRYVLADSTSQQRVEMQQNKVCITFQYDSTYNTVLQENTPCIRGQYSRLDYGMYKTYSNEPASSHNNFSFFVYQKNENFEGNVPCYFREIQGVFRVRNKSFESSPNHEYRRTRSRPGGSHDCFASTARSPQIFAFRTNTPILCMYQKPA